MQRFGGEDELKVLTLFLTSPEVSYTTWIVLSVDGG